MAGAYVSDEYGNDPQLLQMVEALLSVAAEPARFARPAKKYTSPYLPLSNISGGTHKNAVSIHRDFLSFMVPSWDLQNEAQSFGFETHQSTRYGMRLHLVGARASQVVENCQFVGKLLTIAINESDKRKGGAA